MKKYFDITVEGSPELVRGLVTGFIECLARDTDMVIQDRHDSGLGHFLHVLRMREDIHIIVEEKSGLLLKDFLEKESGTQDLRVRSFREILGGRFDFRLRTFSPEVASEIRNILERPPADVRLEGYSGREVRRPEAAGIEAYAPVHDYEFSAEGTVLGPGKPVADTYERLERYEVIELGPLKFEY